MSIGTAEPGVVLAERLGLTILGEEGADLKCVCPLCEHEDAFRVRRENGVMHCYRCKASDTLEVCEAIIGNRADSMRLLIELGLREDKRQSQEPLLDAIARIKRTTPAGIEQIGGKPWPKGEKVIIPQWGPETFEKAKAGEKPEPCSSYFVGRDGVGKNKAKAKTGLFLGDDFAAPGDTCALVEGPFELAETLRHFQGDGKEFTAVYGLPGSTLKKTFTHWFKGVHVFLMFDRDEGGDKGVEHVARVLKDAAASVRVVELPAEWSTKDGPGVRDSLALENGLERIREAITKAKPWEPATNDGGEESTEDEPLIANVEVIIEEDEEGNTKKTAIPLPMADIITKVWQVTGGWPKTAGGVLFVHDETGVHWLESTAALFGWLQSVAGLIDWRRLPRCVGKEELYSELRRTAEKFVAIETLPHVPPCEKIYYAAESIEPGDGAALRGFLDRFSPETDIDRDLLLGLLLTLIWGGAPGSRPAFLITSSAGRGAGKSAMAAFVCELFGGALDFSSHEDIAKIKTRLLGTEALTKRAAMIDNIKSANFSWAELEALITSPVVSGHRMYLGEFARPNFITWILTLNGPNLSADMAQRVVPIRLKKPNYSGGWADDTRQIISEQRTAILGDLIAILKAPAATLAKFTRWGVWEREILARLPEPEDAQRVIAERQGEFDSESEEVAMIEEFIANQLRQLGYDPENNKIFLPSEVVFRWYSWGSGERKTQAAVTRHLHQLVDEGKTKYLTRITGKANGRGLVWFNVSTNAMLLDVQDRIKARRDEERQKDQNQQDSEDESYR